MNRRSFITNTSALVGLAAAPLCAQRVSANARTICAISSVPRVGGLRLLKYFLALTGKTKPRLLLVPTPLGDDPRWIDFWAKQLVPQLDCDLEVLRTFGDSTNTKAHDPRVMSADAIFVTGGNTLNALSVWKAQGIDGSLRSAWEKGIVLGGESAGMVCWFEQGLSDSRPEKLSIIDGLGLLSGSACPHHEQADRRARFRELIASGELKTGVACDSGTALVYRGTRLETAVSIDAASRVSVLERSTDGVAERVVNTSVI